MKKNSKSFFKSLLVLLLGLTVFTPKAIVSAEEKEGLSIITSFYPMYAITEEIVDGIHEVKMINSGNGVHGFEPSAKDVADIYDSDIFIYHSVILESWTKNIRRNLGDRDLVIIEAGENLEMDRVPGLEDFEVIEGMDEKSVLDPHTWLDPVEAAREAQLIAEALAEVDPANKEHYLANADKFTKRAKELVEHYQLIFDSCSQKTFVTQHTAFSYLAKRFGLNQLGISGISNEIEPSAKELAEIREFVKEQDIKTIFIEPNVSTKTAELIADYTGAKLVMLSPLEVVPDNDLSFLENLEECLETLSTRLIEEEQGE